jgi:hypothetical protein
MSRRDRDVTVRARAPDRAPRTLRAHDSVFDPQSRDFKTAKRVRVANVPDTWRKVDIVRALGHQAPGKVKIVFVDSAPADVRLPPHEAADVRFPTHEAAVAGFAHFLGWSQRDLHQATLPPAERAFIAWHVRYAAPARPRERPEQDAADEPVAKRARATPAGATARAPDSASRLVVLSEEEYERLRAAAASVLCTSTAQHVQFSERAREDVPRAGDDSVVFHITNTQEY